MNWEYCDIPNISIENILLYIDFNLIRTIKFGNIAKFPIFILRIYCWIFTSVFLEQILREYCEIPNIYIENILKYIDFFLLRSNILGKLRNSQYLYWEFIEVHWLLSSWTKYIGKIAKFPIFLIRIYWSIFISFLEDQKKLEYCEIPNIYI